MLYSVTKLVTVIKSITAREVFRLCPHVKKRLWSGEFWSDGYIASTVRRQSKLDRWMPRSRDVLAHQI